MPASSRIAGFNIGLSVDARRLNRGLKEAATNAKKFVEGLNRIKLKGVIKGDPFSETKAFLNIADKKLNSIFNTWSSKVGLMSGPFESFEKKTKKNVADVIREFDKVSASYDKIIEKGKKFETGVRHFGKTLVDPLSKFEGRKLPKGETIPGVRRKMFAGKGMEEFLKESRGIKSLSEVRKKMRAIWKKLNDDTKKGTKVNDQTITIWTNRLGAALKDAEKEVEKRGRPVVNKFLDFQKKLEEGFKKQARFRFLGEMKEAGDPVRARTKQVDRIRRTSVQMQKLRTEIKLGINVDQNKIKLLKLMEQQFELTGRKSKHLLNQMKVLRKEISLQVKPPVYLAAGEGRVARSDAAAKQRQINRSRELSLEMKRLRTEIKLGINVDRNKIKLLRIMSERFQVTGKKSTYLRVQMKRLRVEVNRITKQDIGNKIRGWAKSRLWWFAQLRGFWALYRGLAKQIEELTEYHDQLARAMRTARSEFMNSTEIAEKYTAAMAEARASQAATFEQSGETLYQLTSAGLSAEEALAAFNSTLSITIGLEGDARETTKMIAGIYNNFRDELKGAGNVQMQFKQINDLIAGTWKRHQIELSEYTDALKQSSVMGKVAGLSFKELTAILAVTHDHLKRGGSSGRALTNVIMRLARAPYEFVEAFDLEGKIDLSKPLDLLEIFRILNEEMASGERSVHSLGVSFERMGLRGAPQFEIMLRYMNEITEELQQQTKYNGEAKKAEIDRLNSVSGAWQKFTGSISKWSVTWLSPFLNGMKVVLLEAASIISQATDSGVWKSKYFKLESDMGKLPEREKVLEKEEKQVEEDKAERSLLKSAIKGLETNRKELLKNYEKLSKRDKEGVALILPELEAKIRDLKIQHKAIDNILKMDEAVDKKRRDRLRKTIEEIKAKSSKTIGKITDLEFELLKRRIESVKDTIHLLRETAVQQGEDSSGARALERQIEAQQKLFFTLLRIQENYYKQRNILSEQYVLSDAAGVKEGAFDKGAGGGTIDLKGPEELRKLASVRKMWYKDERIDREEKILRLDEEILVITNKIEKKRAEVNRQIEAAGLLGIGLNEAQTITKMAENTVKVQEELSSLMRDRQRLQDEIYQEEDKIFKSSQKRMDIQIKETTKEIKTTKKAKVDQTTIEKDTVKHEVAMLKISKKRFERDGTTETEGVEIATINERIKELKDQIVMKEEELVKIRAGDPVSEQLRSQEELLRLKLLEINKEKEIAVYNKRDQSHIDNLANKEREVLNTLGDIQNKRNENAVTMQNAANEAEIALETNKEELENAKERLKQQLRTNAYKLIEQEYRKKELEAENELIRMRMRHADPREIAAQEEKILQIQLQRVDATLKIENRVSEILELGNKQLKQQKAITENLEDQVRKAKPLYDAYRRIQEQTRTWREAVSDIATETYGNIASGMTDIVFDFTGSYEEQEQKAADLKGEVKKLGFELEEALGEGNEQRAANLRDQISRMNQEIKNLEDPIHNLGEAFENFFKDLIDGIRKAIIQWIAMQIVIKAASAIAGNQFTADTAWTGGAKGGVFPEMKTFKSYAAGGVTSPIKGFVDSQKPVIDTVKDIPRFAKGGIIEGAKSFVENNVFNKVKKFATGGVAPKIKNFISVEPPQVNVKAFSTGGIAPQIKGFKQDSPIVNIKAFATGGIAPQIKDFIDGGSSKKIESVQAFSKGGLTGRPTMAILGDNPSMKELVIPEENIQKDSVSGYVRDREEDGITILNVFDKGDIQAAMADSDGGRVIVNHITRDIAQKGQTYKVMRSG